VVLRTKMNDEHSVSPPVPMIGASPPRAKCRMARAASSLARPPPAVAFGRILGQ
jgi:hypothetical protein